MKTKWLIFSLLFLSAALPSAEITESDFLRVSSGAADETWNTSTPKSTWDVVNQRGERVYLRGVNAGGWLIHEPWMTALTGEANDQYTMMTELGKRFGTEKRDELIAVYEDHYWTEADFDSCAAMGMNVIRLPFSWMNLVYFGDEPGKSRDLPELRPDAFKRLDWFIENCAKRGIYVILDMHGAFGSQNGQDHSGWINDGWNLYTGEQAEVNQRNTVWLWGEIAKRYNRSVGVRRDLAPAIAMYDILNEPGPKAGLTNKLQWDLYHKIYQEIRKYDPDHIICMESCWGPNDLPRTTDHNYNWKNVIYQYHQYVWDHVNNLEGQKAAYRNIVNQVRSANHGVPTYIGEFTAFGIEEAWAYACSTYNAAGWHWTSWTYKVKSSMGSWGVYHHGTENVNAKTTSEDEIRRIWSRVGAPHSTRNAMVHRVLKRHLPGTISDAKSRKVIALPATFSSLDYSYKSSEVVANDDEHGKYVGGLKNNSYLEYLLLVEEAGNYTISIRNAVGANGEFGETKMSLSVEGEPQGEIAGSIGEAWYDFTSVDSLQVKLTAGKKTLRLTASGAVNIETITISPAEDPLSISNSTTTSGVYSIEFSNGTVTLSLGQNESHASVLLFNLLGQPLFERQLSLHSGAATLMLPEHLFKQQPLFLQVKTSSGVRLVRRISAK